jgi:hypothetical protein
MIKRVSGLLAVALVAATMAVLLPASQAVADLNGGCNQGSNTPQTSTRVGATETVNGNDVTYTFESFVTEGSGGIPGLIDYCVYSDTQPNNVTTVAVGLNGDAWVDPFPPFSWGRPDGDPSNIAYDGQSHEMGTATWDSGPPTGFDDILLHVNDPAECSAFYGEGTLTCFVLPGSPGGHGEGAALGIDKTASGSFDKAFTWTISKTACQHGTDCVQSVRATSGTVTFDYTVTVSHDSPSPTNIQVGGTITVNNPNSSSVAIDSLTDQLSDGTNCTITNGVPSSVPAGASNYGYTCSPTGTTATSNTATVAWSDQTLDNGDTLLGGSAPITVGFSFAENDTDECVHVTDPNSPNPPLPADVCVGDSNPTTFNYSKDVPVPTNGVCTSITNTATFTTNDTGATGSASQTVKVCGLAAPGALTMGFWQNKNGQGIITAANQANLGAYLRGYHPFSDAPSSGLAAYVYNIIKNATAKGAAMNAMLKGQMLSTTLDVYFSDPALGGNRINAPSPIGSQNVDLTAICRMIDGSGGTSTCSGTYYDTSSAFGGGGCQTVNALLAYQNTSDPLVDHGAVWYGNVKSTQELAKNTFDAINNHVAFSC